VIFEEAQSFLGHGLEKRRKVCLILMQSGPVCLIIFSIKSKPLL
jgi:hypothetical protein